MKIPSFGHYDAIGVAYVYTEAGQVAGGMIRQECGYLSIKVEPDSTPGFIGQPIQVYRPAVMDDFGTLVDVAPLPVCLHDGFKVPLTVIEASESAEITPAQWASLDAYCKADLT